MGFFLAKNSNILTMKNHTMKNLTLTLIALFIITFVLTSCKKSGSTINPVTSTTSMNFTYNGTAQSFNNCLAVSASAGVEQTLITGENLSLGQVSANSFEVDILADISTIKAGQTFPAISTPNQVGGSVLFYFPNSTDMFVTQPVNAQGTVTVTAITASTISGTFSGKLFAQSDYNANNVIYTITDGTFTALISNK